MKIFFIVKDKIMKKNNNCVIIIIQRNHRKMKKNIFYFIFILFGNILFAQAAGASPSATGSSIENFLYPDCDIEEVYYSDFTNRNDDNILILQLNKSDKPLATTHYNKDCFYSLLIARGNERALTVYNLICVTDSWLNEIIFNINSMKYPTDFKIDDIEYINKPESIEYYAIEDMSFKIVNYLYDLK